MRLPQPLARATAAFALGAMLLTSALPAAAQGQSVQPMPPGGVVITDPSSVEYRPQTAPQVQSPRSNPSTAPAPQAPAPKPQPNVQQPARITPQGGEVSTLTITAAIFGTGMVGSSYRGFCEWSPMSSVGPQVAEIFFAGLPDGVDHTQRCQTDRVATRADTYQVRIHLRDDRGSVAYTTIPITIIPRPTVFDPNVLTPQEMMTYCDNCFLEQLSQLKEDNGQVNPRGIGFKTLHNNQAGATFTIPASARITGRIFLCGSNQEVALNSGQTVCSGEFRKAPPPVQHCTPDPKIQLRLLNTFPSNGGGPGANYAIRAQTNPGDSSPDNPNRLTKITFTANPGESTVEGVKEFYGDDTWTPNQLQGPARNGTFFFNLNAKTNEVIFAWRMLKPGAIVRIEVEDECHGDGKTYPVWRTFVGAGSAGAFK